MKALDQTRNIAKDLSDKDVTLSISRQHKPIVKIGKAAKPKISRLVTRSKAIQVVNLKELRKLDNELSG